MKMMVLCILSASTTTLLGSLQGAEDDSGMEWCEPSWTLIISRPTVCCSVMHRAAVASAQ